jgi:hypothetical protein
MFRFKFGLILGFAAGWLVATGRAAEMVDQLRARLDRRPSPDGTVLDDAGGVYDFPVRATQ